MLGLVSLKALLFSPVLNSFEPEKAGVDAVNEVVQAIGAVVCPINNFAFQAPEMIEIGVERYSSRTLSHGARRC